MRFGFAVGSIIIALGTVGCALLLGIEDKPVVDPVTDAAVENESGSGNGFDASDPCHHVRPPPPTGEDDDSATELKFVVANRTAELGAGDAGVLGFDLDDTCTCAGGPGAAHDAASSCKALATHCDLDGGIDNAIDSVGIVQVYGALEADAPSCGERTLLLVISKYNGRANDSEVFVSPIISPGLDTPHDGTDPPSDCARAGDRTVYKARWDGTDKWSSVAPLVNEGTTNPTLLIKGYVRDWVLVATAIPTLDVAISIGPLDVATRQTTIVARLEPLDENGAPWSPDAGVPPARLRASGQIAARVPLAAIDKTLRTFKTKNLGANTSGFVCPGDDGVYERLKSDICGAIDIITNPAQDFTGADCDALSAVIQFVGEPAQMTKAKALIDPGTSPCAGASPATCR